MNMALSADLPTSISNILVRGRRILELGQLEACWPKTFQIYDLYLYKAFAEDRVEVKAGLSATISK